jgi:hypothetical protein
MDGDGDGPDAKWFLLDQINYDSTAVYEHYGEEEARAADSFLNMSGDGIEEDDDDFALRHEQPIPSEIPIRVLILYICLHKLDLHFVLILVLLLIYIFSSPPLDRRITSPKVNDCRSRRWREDRSSHKWTQRDAYVLLRRLVKGLQSSVGLLFGHVC